MSAKATKAQMKMEPIKAIQSNPVIIKRLMTVFIPAN